MTQLKEDFTNHSMVKSSFFVFLASPEETLDTKLRLKKNTFSGLQHCAKRDPFNKKNQSLCTSLISQYLC